MQKFSIQHWHVLFQIFFFFLLTGAEALGWAGIVAGIVFIWDSGYFLSETPSPFIQTLYVIGLYLLLLVNIHLFQRWRGESIAFFVYKPIALPMVLGISIGMIQIFLLYQERFLLYFS